MKGSSTKKSMEFMTIMTTVIGTMVGAGIYVKNDNQLGHVLGQTQNPFASLFGWLIIGILVMSAMMVFMEIASTTAEHGNGTVSNWSKMFTSRKWASVVSVYYIFTYIPINYAFFSTLIIQYIMAAATGGDPNKLPSEGTLMAIYLCCGLFFLILFGTLNTFERAFGKKLEVWGTIIKFIPLILVLLAIFLPDKEWAVFFRAPASGDVPNTTGSQTGQPWTTSLEGITGMRMFSGFTPIMFAFNGFIYAANMQKETKHKDVVSKAILTGVIFTTIFYILISVSLFLGSKDGSVVSFFDYMFSGFDKSVLAPGHKASSLAILFSNVILVVVCLMGLNSYTLTGTNFYNTDANEGIVFSKNKFITKNASGIVMTIIGSIYYIILVPLAIATGHIAEPGYYMDIAGNGGAILGFTSYSILIIAAMINRKTKKVEVKKLKNWVFWTCAVISTGGLLSVEAYSYLNFFGAFTNLAGGQSIDLPTVLAMAVQIVLIFILWIINEILLKKMPFNAKSVANQENKILIAEQAEQTVLEVRQHHIDDLEKQKKQTKRDFDIIIKANKKKKAPKADVRLFKDIEKERLNAIKNEEHSYKKTDK